MFDVLSQEENTMAQQTSITLIQVHSYRERARDSAFILPTQNNLDDLLPGQATSPLAS